MGAPKSRDLLANAAAFRNWPPTAEEMSDPFL
jgi:hypothetical protein